MVSAAQHAQLVGAHLVLGSHLGSYLVARCAAARRAVTRRSAARRARLAATRCAIACLAVASEPTLELLIFLVATLLVIALLAIALSVDLSVRAPYLASIILKEAVMGTHASEASRPAGT